MSLDLLRDACIKAFTAAAETSTNSAINMQPGNAASADMYAMTQVDRLAYARAMMEATRVVMDEYKRLTQPEKKQDENVTPIKKTGAVY